MTDNTKNMDDGIYTLTDENGNEIQFELIGACEFKGVQYYAMIPADAEGKSEEFCEYVILKAVVENGEENLRALAASGYDVEFLVQQSTPLFISLTEPAAKPKDLDVYRRGGLWVTVKPLPRVFDTPAGVSTRIDLSWDAE